MERRHLNCSNVMPTLVAALGLLLLSSPVASAATFKPTRLDDPAPANKCKPNDCSLREAIRAANNRNGRDRVVLGKGTYELEILPVGGELNTDGQLFVADDLAIHGRGPRATKIDANGIDRVIAVQTGVSAKSSVEGVTIKGGDAGANPFHSDVGGGLLTLGDKVVLKNVVVKQNQAQFGGGIKPTGPNLTIKDSTISGNDGQEGGGIDARGGFVQPFVSIRSSTISGNEAVNGGGVMAVGTGAPGIAPILAVENSTVAGNMASASAGGIAGGQSAIVVLDNTTVAYNRAESDGAGSGAGGGIHENNASFQLNDSVLALNTVGASGSGPACHGEFEDGGSLVDTTGSNPNCNFVGLIQPDVTTVPLIGPLADNGGPTMTIKLLANSPAIGLSLGCPNFDQRGKERPDQNCDAGAFERKGP